VFVFNAQPSYSAFDLERESQITELKTQVTKLTEQVNRLENIIGEMSKRMEAMQIRSDDVMVIRSITRDEAKKEILDLLDKSDKLYYYDIAEALRLDLEEVVQIMSELESEGFVGVVE
jgi:CRP-like cAMP-binding protein